VLDLSVEDAVGFFGAGEARTPAAHAILHRMADVGLGYLRLGQTAHHAVGGERQRLKLATHMGADGGVYVLDEPTTGLHLADLEQLLGLLDRLVDSGKSVIVIEHHQAVMAHADWIIDLGPGAGHDGGRIVFEGTPADLVAARSTLTGEHLAAASRLASSKRKERSGPSALRSSLSVIRSKPSTVRSKPSAMRSRSSAVCSGLSVVRSGLSVPRSHPSAPRSHQRSLCSCSKKRLGDVEDLLRPVSPSEQGAALWISHATSTSSPTMESFTIRWARPHIAATASSWSTCRASRTSS
jgi:energy-coupling factor transporter ATP-binding protein EcfA2